MARPLSEEKREAILVAATELVSSLGTGAATAKIAAAAGVAEGTLFTYFATKDDLLNELLVDIETALAQALLASYGTAKSPRERVQRVWECLVEWGNANPVQRKAMRQLKVSGRISAQTTQRCNAMFGEIREVIEKSLAGHADPKRVPFYIDHVLMGLADIAIEATAINPKNYKHYKVAGFDLFWEGIKA
ncbi:TetR/AcrR family transcriptional regulator [Stenotrophomonas indicatrix]|jgi:AcrR family transcriptional regulator|uniref:TetR/AcrR family transcriptional regulator n=1 Tax=Stenotrophomonas indicatrix TaxID=2045451 RepID=UPI00264CD4EB|nr:TetR/AcrR family transcriptional regulator [Stenotrophomonas indicatrix]MDN8643656.1 TetR/AcrR family transcriptional regulator [Stenotrophomonas indicatrix]MDN8654893.1 TetR/AcrR family transcriptional regulator [Stenotrophomonas indicatrix]